MLRGRQAVQNFRYALLFKISIPVLNIDEMELNVGNRLSGVQMIGYRGAPGRAEEGDSADGDLVF
jgi:hypothetical protein